MQKMTPGLGNAKKMTPTGKIKKMQKMMRAGKVAPPAPGF
jgi:hypothetical protein